ncbi:ABC transporter permease [Mesorhizobium sp. VK25A]|uniref:ABC transporter permease n=1 Tax=Mesorhizobium vachelliae TaxID=3072309 RepID=A0ABU5A5W6_9HYPH|nr:MULTISPECIES: ABC transporter permease [unclassified Mesorhizobium]MDX8533086.1 ABC transporter permease [Mesorhizobium sp. VK25D]MDX8545005.1 ABC transporter permease [Mesorhizobium sp. VK25A]
MESYIPHRQRLWLYILVGLVIFYLVVPTLIVVPVSFTSTTALLFPPPSWSTRWYEAFFQQEKWTGSLWVSIRVGFGTMVLATVTGIAAAYALHVSAIRMRGLINWTLISPLAVPSILIAVGIFFVYAKIGGLLNTITGLILAHTVVAMPFVILTMAAGFKTYDMTQEMVARSLGADRFKAFMTVTLPQLKFSVATSMLLAFLISFDEVIISLMVSSGPVSTLSRVTFSTLRDDVDPTLAAVSTLMLVVTSVPPLLLHIAANRARRKNA